MNLAILPGKSRPRQLLQAGSSIHMIHPDPVTPHLRDFGLDRLDEDEFQTLAISTMDHGYTVVFFVRSRLMLFQVRFIRAVS